MPGTRCGFASSSNKSYTLYLHFTRFNAEWSRVLNIKSNAGLEGRGTGLARQQTQRIVNDTLSQTDPQRSHDLNSTCVRHVQRRLSTPISPPLVSLFLSGGRGRRSKLWGVRFIYGRSPTTSPPCEILRSRFSFRRSSRYLNIFLNVLLLSLSSQRVRLLYRVNAILKCRKASTLSYAIRRVNREIKRATFLSHSGLLQIFKLIVCTSEKILNNIHTVV